MTINNSIVTSQPFRIKLLRILPVEWTVVEQINWNVNNCSLWNSSSIDNSCLFAIAIRSVTSKVRVNACAGHWCMLAHKYACTHYQLLWCWWVETKSFLYNIIKIGDFLSCHIQSWFLHASSLCIMMSLIDYLKIVKEQTGLSSK